MKDRVPEGFLPLRIPPARRLIPYRPDLRRLSVQTDIAEAEIDKSRSAHLPSVRLVGNYEFNTERFDEYGENYMVGAVLEFNLFSGRRMQSRVRESKAAWNEIRAHRKQLETGIRVETRKAFLQCRSSWEQIAVAEAAAGQAREALRIVTDRYRNGLATVVDLLNAESALHGASTRRFAAVHGFRVAVLRLKLAAGTLDVPAE